MKGGTHVDVEVAEHGNTFKLLNLADLLSNHSTVQQRLNVSDNEGMY